MSLYLKYRPKTLEEMEGNEEVVKSLSSLLSRKDGIPHAMLFTGPSGNGKTTLARIVKDALGCSETDYYECNTADFNGIDQIREIRKRMQYMPSEGPVRVWLIDEAHMLSRQAMEAILKLLEDTPSHVYFLLATTDPDKLLKTIKTRCTTFTVSELSPRRIQRLLKKVSVAEDKDVPEEVLKQISTDCLGSCRTALVILDKIIDLEPDEMLEACKQKASEENEVIELCRILLKNNKNDLPSVRKILKGIEQEAESVRRMVLGYCSATYLNSGNGRCLDIIYEFKGNFYDSGKAGLILACANLYDN